MPNSTKPFYRRVWDVTDIQRIFPDAFFITTNVIISPNQSPGLCPEDPSVPGANCTLADNHCKQLAGKYHKYSHGVYTGKCVPINSTNLAPNEQLSAMNGSTCEVEAWCPIYPEKKPLGDDRALLDSIELCWTRHAASQSRSKTSLSSPTTARGRGTFLTSC